jgi:NAD(P)-dependent dehydrogenase (short-subunit alcohol dehydrogenase family)
MSAIFKSANTAVITGGASGIGLALAKRCADAGMKVLVADRDAASLAAIQSVIPQNTPLTTEMDVSNPSDWASLQSKVQSELGGKVSLLALNAGTMARTSFEGQVELDKFQAVMQTNVFGVVNGISALLPLIREKATKADPAAVVITGSKQGITNPPGNPAYNASKAAVKSLAEQLSYSLKDAPVGVHMLVPGWTWTGLAGGVPGGIRDNEKGQQSKKPDAAWWPEQVVEFLEAKMDEGQFWVLCPDNEVTEVTDRKRMLWTAGDAVNGRKPLSRWREEYKDDAAEFMKKDL